MSEYFFSIANVHTIYDKYIHLFLTLAPFWETKKTKSWKKKWLKAVRNITDSLTDWLIS